MKNAIIELAGFSKHRTKKGMGKVALLNALRKGADFILHNVDGCPCQTYCSISDMRPGTFIELVEVKGGFHTTVFCGELVESDFVGNNLDIVA